MSEKAKKLVNTIYQPMGYLNITENSDSMWDWAKKRAVEMLEFQKQTLESVKHPSNTLRVNRRIDRRINEVTELQNELTE